MLIANVKSTVVSESSVPLRRGTETGACSTIGGTSAAAMPTASAPASNRHH